MGLHFSKQILYPEKPNKFTELPCGKIDILDLEIETVKNELSSIMKKIILQTNSEKTKKKNHHTPTWLFEVAKEAIAELRTSLEESLESKRISEIISKGGTMDVGQHTGITKPTTIWPVVQAVIHYYLPKRNFFRILIMSYKIWLLSELAKKQKLTVRAIHAHLS